MAETESRLLQTVIDAVGLLNPLTALLGLGARELIQSHNAEGERLFKSSVRRRLKRVEHRLNDPEFINRPALAEAIKLCWPVVWQTHHQQRIDAATALMVNPLLQDSDPERLEREELDFFARALAQVSNDALRIFARMEQVSTNEGGVLRSARELGDAVGMEPDRAVGACHELERFGFAHSDTQDRLNDVLLSLHESVGRWDSSFDKEPWEAVDIGYAMTALGARFRQGLAISSEQV